MCVGCECENEMNEERFEDRLGWCEVTCAEMGVVKESLKTLYDVVGIWMKYECSEERFEDRLKGDVGIRVRMWVW